MSNLTAAKKKKSGICRNAQAWIVSVNMGYGHQRTAFPLKYLAPGKKIICANDYQGIPARDKFTWEEIRKFYELLSNSKRLPLVGGIIFGIFDRLQRIFDFYPRKGFSRANLQIKQSFSLIKKGWGKALIDKLAKKSIPLVCTFFTPAFMAEFFNYPGEIFCIICDADIARTWAPLDPSASRVKYLAPNSRVIERLKLYGVNPRNIFLTGYPLPQDIIGTEKMEILKEDLKHRMFNLDPQKVYSEKYSVMVDKYLGNLPRRSNHLLTIFFSVGGAGAQKEIAVQALKSLSEKIKNNEVKMILSAGVKKAVRQYFEKSVEDLGLAGNKNVEIIFNENIEGYFQQFNDTLRKTDILWTKPSELSFYSALGLPIIIAPPIGSQEEFNMRWLLKSGFGLLQENPKYTDQWLFDWLNQGYLAEAAFQGFIEGKKLGTLEIRDIVQQCSG